MRVPCTIPLTHTCQNSTFIYSGMFLRCHSSFHKLFHSVHQFSTSSSKPYKAKGGQKRGQTNKSCLKGEPDSPHLLVYTNPCCYFSLRKSHMCSDEIDIVFISVNTSLFHLSLFSLPVLTNSGNIKRKHAKNQFRPQHLSQIASVQNGHSCPVAAGTAVIGGFALGSYKN